MTFESVFACFAHGEPITLVEKHDPSIHIIQNEPFYIRPSFTNVHTKRDAHIILVSAPGATGKSALAKYLAYSYKAIYWNLSEITLGDNSFVGTLVTSIGAENYSGFISDLIAGKTMLVIDAFDEAEMISGQRSVDKFLLDVAQTVVDAPEPCIILLSRAETGQHISRFYQENAVAFCQYEISFFSSTAQKNFISKVYERKKGISVDPIIQSCIDAYQSKILQFVEEDEAGSFIGYAPVLEVIGTHIAEESNAYKFLNELLDAGQTASGIDIVARIMAQLLEREHEKVVSALEKRIKDKYDYPLIYKEIYTEQEQLARIVNFVMFGDFDKDAYHNDEIPLDILDEYNAVLEGIIKQHPFIRVTSRHGTEFTGPAFRDYVLSELFTDSVNDDMVEMYFCERRVSVHFPSHLLWGFFTSKDDVFIPCNKIPYLLESFKSQASATEQAFLSILNDIDSEGSAFSSEWSLIDIGKQHVIKKMFDYSIVGFDKDIWLENLVNVFIDVDCPLHILSTSRSSRISNSTVICKKLLISSEQIIFDVYEPKKVILISQENAELNTLSGVQSEIIVNGNSLEISFPNSKQYFKLVKFNKEYSEDSDITIELFAYCLRKIMVHFRKHRKDTPARDAEKIDFVVVGSNRNRKSVFNFLVDNGVIYRDNPLYKINVEKLAAVGISWGAVTSGDNQQLSKVYTYFTKWLDNQSISK